MYSVRGWPLALRGWEDEGYREREPVMTAFFLGLGREDGNGGVGMGRGSVRSGSPRCKETPRSQEPGREGGWAGRRFLEGRLVYDFLPGVCPGAPHTLPVHSSYLQKEIQGTSLLRISSCCHCLHARTGTALLFEVVRPCWLSSVPILAAAAGGLPWNC